MNETNDARACVQLHMVSAKTDNNSVENRVALHLRFSECKEIRSTSNERASNNNKQIHKHTHTHTKASTRIDRSDAARWKRRSKRTVLWFRYFSHSSVARWISYCLVFDADTARHYHHQHEVRLVRSVSIVCGIIQRTIATLLVENFQNHEHCHPTRELQLRFSAPVCVRCSSIFTLAQITLYSQTNHLRCITRAVCGACRTHGDDQDKCHASCIKSGITFTRIARFPKPKVKESERETHPQTQANWFKWT